LIAETASPASSVSSVTVDSSAGVRPPVAHKAPTASASTATAAVTPFQKPPACLPAVSFRDPPQLEQKAVFSLTEAPHLEQYFMAFLLFWLS
jgi:hypothetical protein